MAMNKEVVPSDFSVVAAALASKLSEMGVINPKVGSPAAFIESALVQVVKDQGEQVFDLAWKDGTEISRYDEDSYTTGFAGLPTKPVQKRCFRLSLTWVPGKWTPRHT